MNNKWLILSLIILMYLPVSIDATVLHVAVPTLSIALNASASELLWIIDIYSLVMAGLLLPMGVLGDKYGYKILAIMGLIIFGIASFCAALSPNTLMLIFSRSLLAVGASMILPATLSGVRNTFLDEKNRSLALGVWSTVGIGGAAIGPLVGGYLLNHFHWGSVFWINIPIVIVTIIITLIIVPKQPINEQQSWQISKALVFIVAILMSVYAIKSALNVNNSLFMTIIIGLAGVLMLTFFVKRELNSHTPMIDFTLLKQRVLVIGIIMALTAMISIVGFELLMAQELQFVHGLTPLEAGLFMLPLMLASGVGGSLAGWLVFRLGLRIVATFGMGLSALSFFGLAICDFINYPLVAWGLMILLGLSVGLSLLASTSAIMTSAPANKSASAGAIESMAYELGAGFGIVLFGIMLTLIFNHNIIVPVGITGDLAAQAKNSINEAFFVANQMGQSELSNQLIASAKQAFVSAHMIVLFVSGLLLSALTVTIWLFLPEKAISEQNQHH